MDLVHVVALGEEALHHLKFSVIFKGFLCCATNKNKSNISLITQKRFIYPGKTSQLVGHTTQTLLAPW